MYLDLRNWKKYSVSDLKNLFEVVNKNIMFPTDIVNRTLVDIAMSTGIDYYLLVGFMKGFVAREVVDELSFIYDKRINLSSKKYIKRRISELERLKSSYCEKCSYEKEKKDLTCFSGKTSACCLGCYEKCDYRCSFSKKQFKSKGYEVLSNNLVKISISIDREKLEELVYFAGELNDDDILDDKIAKIINNSIAKSLGELRASEIEKGVN